jgi:tryptophanyl-tRNA synthetase
MAADILLYDTNVVPVGKDQKQHLEMARDLALKFNNIFGETFVVPEPMIREESAVVPGVDGQKMSKSYGNTIPIFGSEKDVKKAIMGIVSDSKGMNDPKDPDTSVIFQIHKLFLSPAEQKALIAEYKNGLPYGDAKKKLLETYLDYFADMRKKREELLKDEGYVKEVMQEGAKKAGEVAERTILKVKRAVGLL